MAGKIKPLSTARTGTDSNELDRRVVYEESLTEQTYLIGVKLSVKICNIQ